MSGCCKDQTVVQRWRERREGIRRLKMTRVTWTAVLPYSGREIELRRHERRFQGIEKLERMNEGESHTKIREEKGELKFHIIALYDKLKGIIYSTVYLLSLVEICRS
jgi:hypothetical protein